MLSIRCTVSSLSFALLNFHYISQNRSGFLGVNKPYFGYVSRVYVSFEKPYIKLYKSIYIYIYKSQVYIRKHIQFSSQPQTRGCGGKWESLVSHREYESLVAVAVRGWEWVAKMCGEMKSISC